MTPRFGQVALPLPLARPYTYRIPESIADRIEPGARVLVDAATDAARCPVGDSAQMGLNLATA